MHVKAKTMAFCGLLLALSVICMVLGSIIETNTLFLLGAASFFVGIVVRCFGKKAGAAFYLAGVLLGFIVAPNKFYVFTFGAMSLYILIREFAWEWLGRRKADVKKKRQQLWIIKYAVFNVLYIPTVLGFQNLLFAKDLGMGWLLVIIAAGQVGLLIYDGAYEYVQRYMGKWLRNGGIWGENR